MTDRLYYDQPYLTEFDAVVTAVRADGRAVSLDRSAFYPTSGGQPHDTGALNGLPVTDVTVDEAGEVWHEIGGALRAGELVHGVIDWPRRFDHMQQHAGEHMIAGALWRLFGGGTIGLHLGADFSTIDVTMPGGGTHLTPGQIAAVEDEVNAQIQRDAPIRCWFPDAEALKRLPLRKPPTVAEHVRVVAIGDYEMVACGGTHPSSAGQIGLVKIVDARPSKGKVRVAFVCGARAARDYRLKFDACAQAAAMLSAKPEQLPESVGKMKETIAALEREIAALRQAEAVAQAPALIARAESIGGARVVRARLEGASMDALRALAAALVEENDVVALLAAPRADGENLVFARGGGVQKDMGALLRRAAAAHGGKGGGKPDFAQGGAPDAAALDTAIGLLKNSAQ